MIFSLSRKEYIMAKEDFEKSLDHDPDFQDARSCLGLIRRKLGSEGRHLLLSNPARRSSLLMQNGLSVQLPGALSSTEVTGAIKAMRK